MLNSKKTIAVLESVKSYEQRIPIHPKHFYLIGMEKQKVFFQKKYAKRFEQADQGLIQFGFSVASRDTLLADADIIFLLKPMASDLKKMKKGAVLIGWCHAVQQIQIANIAKERGLTLVAMEKMYKYQHGKKEHLFYKNNFLSGRLGVQDALSCAPIEYENSVNVSVLTFGAVGQGVVSELLARGFSNITVFSRRDKNRIPNLPRKVNYKKFFVKNEELLTSDGEKLKALLLESNIIINCILQDPLDPYEFLTEEDLKNTDNKLIIDISCDDKMGFDFSHSTSFKKPIEKIGNNFYYAIDHTPTLMWREISLYLSSKLLPILNSFLANKFDDKTRELLDEAIEIRDGKIINQVITDFQNKIKQIALV